MNIPHEINRRTVKLVEILGEANSALIQKNTVTAKDIDGVPESIEEIQVSTGIQPGDLEDIEVVSGNANRTYSPPEGKGYGNITVIGEPNLGAENIAKGRNLFGITGIYPRLEDLATINVRSQVEDQWVSADTDIDINTYPGIGKVHILGEKNLASNVVLNGVNIFGVVGNYKIQPLRNITITSQGYTNITPGNNSSSMEKVRVYVNVPQQTITKEDWSVTLSDNGTYNYYPTNQNLYKGTGRISIKVNVPKNVTQNIITSNLGSRTFTITSLPKTYYASSYSLDGFNSVTIKADTSTWANKIADGESILGVTGRFVGKTNATFKESITVNSKNTAQTFNASTYNVDGFRQVVVPAQPNLTPSNIKNGVTICGVTGSHVCANAPWTPTLQSKYNVIPKRNGVTVNYSSGYDGLNIVTIKAEQNLQANCIARGKTIFNVEGTYDGELQEELVIFPNEDTLTYGPDEDGKIAVKKVKVMGTGQVMNGTWQEGYDQAVEDNKETVDRLQGEIKTLEDEMFAKEEAAYENGRVAGVAEGEQKSAQEIYGLEMQVEDLLGQVDSLEDQVKSLEGEYDRGYDEGHSAGFEDGKIEGIAQLPNFDEMPW